MVPLGKDVLKVLLRTTAAASMTALLCRWHSFQEKLGTECEPPSHSFGCFQFNSFRLIHALVRGGFGVIILCRRVCLFNSPSGRCVLAGAVGHVACCAVTSTSSS